MYDSWSLGWFNFAFLFSAYMVRPSLDLRRVEHDAGRGSHGAGREVAGETGADDSRVSVGRGDLSPNDLDSLGGVVNIGDTLAEVELDILASVDSLDLQERVVHVLCVISPANHNKQSLDDNSSVDAHR